MARRLVFGEDSLPAPERKSGKQPPTTHKKGPMEGQTDVWRPPPLPPKPSGPCHACGSQEWYPRPEFARWDCPICRPPLGQGQTHQPDVKVPRGPSWAPWCARCHPTMPRGKGWDQLKCYRCDKET